MDMPKIQQRMASELSSKNLLLNNEITDTQPDVMCYEKLQVREEDHESSQVFIGPEIQPVAFVSFGDKNPAMEESVIETDTSEYEDGLNCMVTWDGLKNKMKGVLSCVSANGGRPYTYFIESHINQL